MMKRFPRSRGRGYLDQGWHVKVLVSKWVEESQFLGGLGRNNCHFRQKRHIFKEFTVDNIVRTLWIQKLSLTFSR